MTRIKSISIWFIFCLLGILHYRLTTLTWVFSTISFRVNRICFSICLCLQSVCYSMFFYQPFVFLCSYFVHHRRVNSFMLINHFSFYNMPVFSFQYQKGKKGTIMGTVITTQLLSELHDVRGKALREVENIPETILIERSCHQSGSLQSQGWIRLYRRWVNEKLLVSFVAFMARITT